MAIEVKKISDLPEATSVTGDELLEMAFNGVNYKVRARKLVEGRDISLYDVNGLSEVLNNKVDKVPGKQLSDQNFTQAEKNKLSNLNYLLDDKVDREWGKGLIEPAPNDGKQYARKNNAWVEVGGVGGGLRTYLDGTTLFMTSDGSSPAPAPKPISYTFSYEIEVGQDIHPDGEFEYYGVNEAFMGTFINKIENDKIGNLVVLEWGNDQEYGYSISGTSENSDYLLTYGKNIELNIRDQNGDILSVTITPENIFETGSGDVNFGVNLTEEQFNLLPKNGVVFVDIVLDSVSDDDLFRYEFEIGASPYGAYGAAEADFIGTYGTFNENNENDKIGKLIAAEWGANEEGYSLIVGSVSSDYLLSYNSNLELIVHDQSGEIVRVTVTPDDIFELTLPEFSELLPPFVMLEAFLTEEQYNLLPKNGRVFLYMALEPEPEKTSFRYVIDIGQNVDSSGSFANYGVLYDSGSFIENEENDKLGNVTRVMWSYSTNYSGIVYDLDFIMDRSSTLHTHNKDIEIRVSGQNGEFLSIIVPPEDIGVMATGYVYIEYLLTEEQFNLLPTSGIAIIDIDLEPAPAPELLSYKFEVGEIINLGNGDALYGVSETDFFGPLGTFIENIENDKLGQVTAVTWSSREEYGYDIYITAANSDYLLFNETSIELIIRDQDGEILRLYLEPWDVEEMPSGEVMISTYLYEEDFNLLPKSGVVFVDMLLEPYVGGPVV